MLTRLWCRETSVLVVIGLVIIAALALATPAAWGTDQDLPTWLQRGHPDNPLTNLGTKSLERQLNDINSRPERERYNSQTPYPNPWAHLPGPPQRPMFFYDERTNMEPLYPIGPGAYIGSGGRGDPR